MILLNVYESRSRHLAVVVSRPPHPVGAGDRLLLPSGRAVEIMEVRTYPGRLVTLLLRDAPREELRVGMRVHLAVRRPAG
jgi:hypothetical protein|nr:MAG: hypothetical protein KatS3mg041_1579 [Bacteroidota bacterium]